MARGLEPHKGAKAFPDAEQREINKRNNLENLKLGKKPESKARNEVAKATRNETVKAVALRKGAPTVSPERKSKINADHKEHSHLVAEAYKDSLKSAENYNKGVQESIRKAGVSEAYNNSLKSAEDYNKGVQESVRKASVANEYQKSLDAAGEYNKEVQESVEKTGATGTYQERSAAAAKRFNADVGAAVARPGASMEARPDRLPPVGRWGAGVPGQREAGRQRPRVESPAPSEPISEPELRSVFGTREPDVDTSRPGRLGRGENIGRQRELGPVAGSHLRNTCRNAQQAPENAERRSWWGFFKERVKGFATLGILEFWHAEKFRRGTKRTAGEVTAQSSMLDQTRDMDIDQAQEEANRIRQMVGASLTGGPQSLTTGNILNIQAASNQIDAEKAASNTRLMNRIVAQARGNVQERLAKYKNQFGQNVVGDERLAQFEERLRAELASSTIGRGIREPSVIKREINFKQAVRERLDKNYWSRYVYGTLDLLAWGGIAKLASGYLASGGMNLAPVPVPGTETVPMHDTIWKTAGEWLQQQGISNPTNAQIMDISKQVAIDNGIGVKEWGIAGNPLDTVMQQDHALKFVGPALKAIMASW